MVHILNAFFLSQMAKGKQPGERKQGPSQTEEKKSSYLNEESPFIYT